MSRRSGFVQHLKLPHYVDFQSELEMVRGAARASSRARRQRRCRRRPRNDRRAMPARRGYNFAYLDEQTKRMIRRAILKAVAIPGYQVPFGSREMPLPYGWGTGGIQVTASIIGPRRRAEGHRPGRRRHHQRGLASAASSRTTAGVATTEQTREATIIQTRHRMPGDAAARGPDPRLPGADPRAAALARAARDRDAQDARAGRIRRHAREALRGHRPARPHRHRPTTIR